MSGIAALCDSEDGWSALSARMHFKALLIRHENSIESYKPRLSGPFTRRNESRHPWHV